VCGGCWADDGEDDEDDEGERTDTEPDADVTDGNVDDYSEDEDGDDESEMDCHDGIDAREAGHGSSDGVREDDHVSVLSTITTSVAMTIRGPELGWEPADEEEREDENQRRAQGMGVADSPSLLAHPGVKNKASGSWPRSASAATRLP
jgi:hypothetical protein